MVTYINKSIPLGDNIVTALQGAGQFVVGTIDETLNPANGNTQLASVTVTLALVTAVIGSLIGLWAMRKKTH